MNAADETSDEMVLSWSYGQLEATPRSSETNHGMTSASLARFLVTVAR